MAGLRPRPPRVLLWIRDGRAFMKFDGGWLELGPEASVSALDPAAQLALVHERLKGAHWHPIPRRVN